MITRLKSWGAQVLGAAQLFPTPKTGRASVEQLIHGLHPVIPPKPLVRFGPRGDGGYLLPDDLDGVRTCFSPGVSDIAGFEMDCAARGLDVFMADYSVDGPPTPHDRFFFTKHYIGAYTQGPFISMEDWVAQAQPPEGDLLLQMDIEGYEYETLLSMPEALQRRFRVVVLELHNLHWLWSRPFFDLAGRALEKLLQTHACVHLHPNNYRSAYVHAGLAIPKLMEATFLRRDRLTETRYATTFPHPLDVETAPGPPLVLPPAWYRQSA